MNKIISIFAALFLISLAKAQSPLTFTLNNLTGSQSITCTYTSINIMAITNYSAAPVTYSWVSSNASLTGSNVLLTNSGNYTITALASNTITSVQYLSIGINTTSPNSTVTPLLQNMTCANPIVQHVTVTAAPLLNVEHNILSSVGGTVSFATPTAIFYPGPGTHTYVLINLTNGCSTTKTFTVLTGGGFPTFSLVSPQNFTLGCGSHSIITINMVNGQTTNSLSIPNGGAVSYTLLPPWSSGTYSTNLISTYTNIISPGTWTAVVKDPNSGCESKVPVSVIQNTVGPQIQAIAITQILTCFTPSIQLQGTSTTPNVTYNWLTPSGNQAGSALSVSSTANLTNTIVANYTLTITDISSACRSSSTVPVYQNLFPPNVSIMSSSSVITCIMPTVTLSNNSSVTSPNNFPHPLGVQALIWQGPPPQIDLQFSSTYVASTPGVYTLTARDLNNGCIGTKTLIIADNRIFPIVNNPVDPGSFDLCNSPTVTLVPIITNPTQNYTYQWLAPPNASISAVTNSVLVVNSVGIYTIVVTNNVNQCSSTGTISAIKCVGLKQNQIQNSDISLFPNPTTGLITLSTKDRASSITVAVYNAIGELVKKQVLNKEKETINLQNEARGIYFIYLLENSVPTYISKIVKE